MDISTNLTMKVLQKILFRNLVKEYTSNNRQTYFLQTCVLFCASQMTHFSFHLRLCRCTYFHPVLDEITDKEKQKRALEFTLE